MSTHIPEELQMKMWASDPPPSLSNLQRTHPCHSCSSTIALSGCQETVLTDTSKTLHMIRNKHWDPRPQQQEENAGCEECEHHHHSLPTRQTFKVPYAWLLSIFWISGIQHAIQKPWDNKAGGLRHTICMTYLHFWTIGVHHSIQKLLDKNSRCSKTYYMHIPSSCLHYKGPAFNLENSETSKVDVLRNNIHMHDPSLFPGLLRSSTQFRKNCTTSKSVGVLIHSICMIHLHVWIIGLQHSIQKFWDKQISRWSKTYRMHDTSTFQFLSGSRIPSIQNIVTQEKTYH